jgi:hypothetical protein
MSGKVEFQSVTSAGRLRRARRPAGNLEDEVRTTGRPQHWTRTQEPPRRYPIQLQLHYKAETKYGPLYGFGQTRMMSSQEIIFGGGNGLQRGMKAEIVLAWPRLLDGHIRLQLVLEATITGSQGGVTEARILAYQFRTRGPVETGAGSRTR